MTTTRTAILALTLSLSPAPAQGLVQSNETFHYGILEADRGGGCGLTSGIQIYGQAGVARLRADGSLSRTGFETRVCPSGTASTTVNTENGTYRLRADGRLEATTTPAPSGAFVILKMRFDHGMLLYDDEPSPKPILFVAVKRPTGTPPSLAGSWYVARMVQSQGGGTFSARTDAGRLTIGAGGGFTESGLRHATSASGTTDTAYATSGSIALASDGRLTANPGGHPGAVSADGEFLFWIERSGSSVGITLAVRRGSGHAPGAMNGAWHVGRYSAQTTGGPMMTSAEGRLRVTGGSGYRLDGSRTALTATSLGTTALLATGAINVAADGLLTASDMSTGTNQIGGLSSSGRYAILANVSAAGFTRIELAYRECVDPVPYGTSTAGTGGIRPQLASAGGASRFGNAAFALELSRAVGGTLGVFAVAGRPAPGVPGFGGTVWLDSGALLVSSTITTSGVAGVAGAGTGSLSLPLVGSSSLIGADLYAQVFVLDMGAPAGVSMTRGLAVDVCQ